jgi:hypothetical protein
VTLFVSETRVAAAIFGHTARVFPSLMAFLAGFVRGMPAAVRVSHGRSNNRARTLSGSKFADRKRQGGFNVHA